MNEELRLTEDVYYLHPQKGWCKSFVCGRVKRKDVQYYILAGYCPPVHFKCILTEVDYNFNKQHNQLELLAEKIGKEGFAA